VVRPAGPSGGAAGTGDDGDGGDGELLLALESEAEGLTWEAYAARIFEPDKVATDYWTGSWMQERVKRRFATARRILRQYRDMAAGTPPATKSPAKAPEPPSRGRDRGDPDLGL